MGEKLYSFVHQCTTVLRSFWALNIFYQNYPFTPLLRHITHLLFFLKDSQQILLDIQTGSCYAQKVKDRSIVFHLMSDSITSQVTWKSALIGWWEPATICQRITIQWACNPFVYRLLFTRILFRTTLTILILYIQHGRTPAGYTIPWSHVESDRTRVCTPNSLLSTDLLSEYNQWVAWAAVYANAVTAYKRPC